MVLLRQLRRPVVWVPISLALLAFLAWRSGLWEAGDRLGRIDPAPLVGALFLGGAIPVLWAVRSSRLLGATGHAVPIPALIPITAFANTLNNLTPGSSGEVVRLWILNAQHGVGWSNGAAVILVERLVSLGYLTGSAILLWLAWLYGWPGPVALALLVALAASPAVIYGTGLRPSRFVTVLPLGRMVGPERWATFTAWFHRVDDTIARLLVHPGRLALFALVTAGILTINTTQLVLVGRALGITIEPIAAWGALGIGITAGALSLLPFGLGSADLVIATLLGVAGVPSVEAVAMTFGYRLVSTLPMGLAGVLSYAFLSARLPDASAWDAARGALAGDAAGDRDRT